MKGPDIGGIDEPDTADTSPMPDFYTPPGSFLAVIVVAIILWVYLSVRDLVYTLRQRFL